MRNELLTFGYMILLALCFGEFAVGMPGVPANVIPTLPTTPNQFRPRHKGGDTVCAYLVYPYSRLGWATSAGYVFSSDDMSNCGTELWTFSDDFVMDKQSNYVCECNGRANPGPTTAIWCGNSSWLFKRPGPVALGFLGQEVIYRKCSGLTYRWSVALGELSVPEATTDWIEFRTDEGTHVLEYGTFGQPYGLRVVSSTGSGILVGQILYPPNGAWTVADYSLKADSITVRVTNASTGERRCDYYAKSGSTFALVRSMTASQLGGDIVGIGDRRAAVWNSAQPGRLAVLRMDYQTPYVETVFDLPITPDGTDYGSIPFAYVRRGSLVCVGVWAGATQARLIAGNRREQASPCPGDLTADGAVDGADIGVLLDQWGQVSALNIADINRDGRIDGADLGLLLTKWGPCPN